MAEEAACGSAAALLSPPRSLVGAAPAAAVFRGVVLQSQLLHSRLLVVQAPEAAE